MCAGYDARREDASNQLEDSSACQPPALSIQGWKGRRRAGAAGCGGFGLIMLALLLISMLPWASAVFVEFDNCLEESIIRSNQLQFVPMNVSVSFDPANSPHPLNITVYGNVSGIAAQDQSSPYPAPDDPQWTNPSDTVGKIEDLSKSNNKYTTLFSKFNVLTFTPYNEASRFCKSVVQGECPLGPVFYANASNLTELRAFFVQQDMLSSYRFATITPTLRVRSGDASNADLACISMPVTPDLGTELGNVLTYVPLVILLMVGIATITAATYSPWGSTDPFRWTSNYGRDEDLLRLVTPGFGDCLQYIQFVVLTGGLSLNYPGFYQPLVSQAAWSTLMFNESFVSHGSGRSAIVDGIYVVNGTYGLERLGRLVGMSGVKDIWPGMAVWLLVILGCVTSLIQLAFGFRWLHRQIAHVPEEDLRAKNMPFTVGTVVRIVFNYLFLPLVSLSMFQLVVARDSPAYSVVLAVIFIVALICFAIWLIRLIVTTRPRSYLFDDLSTVLLYGPLYNTFSDDAAPFALVPIAITFIRGVAIGAVQPSGVAQLVLLAICEVIFLLTLTAFRPFPSPTSMNLYHACFSIIRFVVLLLAVSFVPSLGVSEAARGWIGYIILFIHAMVLVFGFFLNALQTLIEVLARLAGAGGYEGGATRGGLVKVFGMRQLSRRDPRPDAGTRQSMNSEAAMLANMEDRRSGQFEGSRARSLSGSSAMLLNRPGASDGRASLGYDTASRGHSRANSSGPYTPTTVGGPGYQAMAGGSPGGVALIGMESRDPYYRPPRPRRPTLDNPAAERSRGQGKTGSDPDDDGIDGPSGSGADTPVAAYLSGSKEDPDYGEPRPRTDYAVREVDFYYRVRGPALSHTGTRKLKTGPADPTGPVSSARSWFQRLLGGKTKEKGKGFEVVRGGRAPPPGLLPPTEGEMFHEPYRDDPDARDSDDAGNEPTAGGLPRDGEGPYRDSDGEENAQAEDSGAPSLPQIDSGGAIELPDRAGSQRSAQGATAAGTRSPPALPRKSSRRVSSIDTTNLEKDEAQSAAAGPDTPTHQLQPSNSQRLPFSGRHSSTRDRTVSLASTVASTASSNPQAAADDNDTPSTSTRPRLKSALGSFASDTENDRPSSVGYVPQHRTSDNIHEASPDDEVSFRGSSAELVGAPPAHEPAEES
ncbi:hypothetical protein VTN02DRAFT_6263 [Thermoascus thermophilus]